MRTRLYIEILAMPKPRKFAVRRKKGMDISRMKTVLVAEDEASIRDFIVINYSVADMKCWRQAMGWSLAYL